MDLSAFRPAAEPPGVPTVLYAGRMLTSKGVGDLVEAARRLRGGGTQLRLVLAGHSDADNPEAIPEARLRAWAAAGDAEWTGRIEDVAAAMAAAAVVVLASEREGVPKVLVEACGAGRAIVATDVPGCRDVVADGVNGLLVPVHDAAALAAALGTLLADPDLRARMGAAGPPPRRARVRRADRRRANPRDLHPRPRRMTVFVTGATGVVGPVLVRELLEAGHAVRALVRDPKAALPAGAERVAGGLGDADALARGAAGADAVVHLAALLHINGPAAEMADRYRAVNVEGTRRLVDAARAAGVAQVAFASTINVYGPSRGGAPWTEGDALHPDTLYGETKRDAEPLVRALPGGIVLRLAAVYGPGMKGNYPSLMRVLRRGVRLLPGDGQNRRTLVHVADAARAFALAATGGIPAGTYNLTDGQVHRFDAVVRSLQVAAGRRPGVRYVPAGLVRSALRVPETLAGLAGRAFPGPLLVDKMTEDVAVAGDALIAASAYRPRVTRLADGWLSPDAP